jgi:hypothetical protein
MTRSLTLFLLVATFAQSASAGGPWPRKKNSGYAQLGFTYIGYSKFFNHEGKITELPRAVTDLTSQVYIDFGLTDRLTMSANLPFKYVATGDKLFASDPTYFTDTTFFADTLAPSSLFGLNNVMLGFKYNIINRRVLFSVGLNAEANAAKYDSLSTLRTGPSAFVIHPYLSTGTTFYKDKFYTLLDAGYRVRLKDYSDEIDFNFELGFSWNQKTYFIANVAGRFTVGEGSRDNNSSTKFPNGRDLLTSLYPNNQQYVGYGLKFIQKIKKVHINAAVYFGTGNMVAAALSYNLGVAYEW